MPSENLRFRPSTDRRFLPGTSATHPAPGKSQCSPSSLGRDLLSLKIINEQFYTSQRFFDGHGLYSSEDGKVLLERSSWSVVFGWLTRGGRGVMYWKGKEFGSCTPRSKILLPIRLSPAKQVLARHPSGAVISVLVEAESAYRVPGTLVLYVQYTGKVLVR